MRKIVYKGQHCYLISDVEKLIAQKDEQILEQNEKISNMAITIEEMTEALENIKTSKKGAGKKKDKDPDPEPKTDEAPPIPVEFGTVIKEDVDEGPDELGERPEEDNFDPPIPGESKDESDEEKE